MKTFLITSASLLMVVLVLVVAAFLYVQRALAPEAVPPAPTATTTRSEGVVVRDLAGVSGAPVATDTQATGLVPKVTEPIKLSTLPLSDAQKSMLGTAGIDVDTFVITPEMIACAEAALGAERFAAIVGGDAPGATEIFSLLRCL